MKKLFKKYKKRILIALAMMLASSAVNAEGSLNEKIYMGFGISETSLKINQNNTIIVNGLEKQSVFEDDGFGLTAYVGIRLDEYLSLELGYNDMGSVQLTDSQGGNNFLDVQSVYVDAVLSRQVIKNIDVFALVGVSVWELTGKYEEPVSDGTDLRYGAGMDINLYGKRNRLVRIKWEHQEFDNLILSDSDTISASLMFKF